MKITAIGLFALTSLSVFTASSADAHDRTDKKILKCVRTLVKHQIDSEEGAVRLIKMIDEKRSSDPSKFLEACQEMKKEFRGHDGKNAKLDYEVIAKSAGVSAETSSLVTALDSNQYVCKLYGIHVVAGVITVEGVGIAFGSCKYQSGEIYATTGLSADIGVGAGVLIGGGVWRASSGPQQFDDFRSTASLGEVLGIGKDESDGIDGKFVGIGSYLGLKAGAPIKMAIVGNSFTEIWPVYDRLLNSKN